MKIRLGGLFGSSSFESTPVPMYVERQPSGREKLLRDELDRIADQRDEAWSIIERLVTHLDATLPEGKYVDQEGKPAKIRRDWLWEICFGRDHELYDDIYACLGGRFVHDRLRATGTPNEGTSTDAA
jgi:hypothetical protein